MRNVFLVGSKMSSTSGGIKIMECIYVMLESGCIITGLAYVGNRFTIDFTMNNSAWTVRSRGKITETAVNGLCEQLKSFNIISRDDWNYHTMRFYCHKASSNANDRDGRGAGSGVQDVDDDDAVRPTHNKNIAIMTFILNAILKGWRVKKSFSRISEYRFNKSHKSKRKYLNADFLSRFLEHNIQTQ